MTLSTFLVRSITIFLGKNNKFCWLNHHKLWLNLIIAWLNHNFIRKNLPCLLVKKTTIVLKSPSISTFLLDKEISFLLAKPHYHIALFLLQGASSPGYVPCCPPAARCSRASLPPTAQDSWDGAVFIQKSKAKYGKTWERWEKWDKKGMYSIVFIGFPWHFGIYMDIHGYSETK